MKKEYNFSKGIRGRIRKENKMDEISKVISDFRNSDDGQTLDDLLGNLASKLVDSTASSLTPCRVTGKPGIQVTLIGLICVNLTPELKNNFTRDCLDSIEYNDYLNADSKVKELTKRVPSPDDATFDDFREFINLEQNFLNSQGEAALWAVDWLEKAQNAQNTQISE